MLVANNTASCNIMESKTHLSLKYTLNEWPNKSKRNLFFKKMRIRIIKSRMYNNLAWTSNHLSIFMKIPFHYKLSNSAQRKDFLKIWNHFLSFLVNIWKKEEKSDKMREIVLRSTFELKNKPLRLILDYDWCNANQDELCISLDSHQFLFYIEPYPS